MFYFLRQNLFESLGMIDVVSNDVTSQYFWIAGQKFDAPVPHQELQLDPVYGTNYPDFFDTSIPLMSTRLLTALRSAGVDNIDSYPMTLVRPDTGERTDDYSAVNLVGDLDAIDLARSPHRIAFDEPEFTGPIAIDPSRTRDLLAFRLLHCPGLMVVTASVAAQLRPANFAAVMLQPTTEYKGI